MADESPGRAAKSDLGRRFVTAVFLLPVIAVIYHGGAIALALVIGFGLIMAAEAVQVTGRGLATLSGLVQIILCLAPAAAFIWSGSHASALLFLAGAGLFSLATSRSLPFMLVAGGIAASIFALTGIIRHPLGGDWLLLMIAVVVAADSAAYFIGRAVGGPKLAPVISPSKTWSGAIAGLAGGGLAGVGMGMLLGFPPLSAGLMGLVMADLSIGGDLLESWFKRRYKVKDSGRILPGHGGLLDRFDGYLLAAPFLYIVLAAGGLNG
ncbi:phosphatidate cytidylyltransferase [Alphaproteobacteria bacterium LSUCC0684]